MSQIERFVGVEHAGSDTTTTVESSYRAGLQAIDSGNLEAARQWARRCTSAPDGATAARCAILHGLIAIEEGDFETAVTHFRRAAAIRPDDVTVARQLGQLLATSGAASEAIQVLEAALESAPNNIDLLVDLGYICIISGDHQRARSFLEQAEALPASTPEVQYALAQMYETLGDLAHAASILAVAVRATAVPRLLIDLARLYLQLQRYKEAEAVFGTLARVDPDYALFAEHGQIWCRIKQQDWRTALDLALTTIRVDRFDLTTGLLAYAKDRLFTHIPDAEQREAELGARFMTELHEHVIAHSNDITSGWGHARRGE